MVASRGSSASGMSLAVRSMIDLHKDAASMDSDELMPCPSAVQALDKGCTTTSLGTCHCMKQSDKF